MISEAELVAIEQRAARLESASTDLDGDPQWLLGLQLVEDIAELVAFVRSHREEKAGRGSRCSVQLYPVT